MKLLVLAIPFLLIYGCFSGSTTCNLTGNNCSCNILSSEDNPRCVDHEGNEPASASDLCTQAGGVFSQAALCASANRAGTCVMDLVGQKQYSRYYWNDFSTALTARAACEYLWLSYQAIPGASFDWVSD